MKRQMVTCEECGRKYRKKCYDLDLKVGDRVIYKCWIGTNCEDLVTTVTDITHKKDGLYFGRRRSTIWPHQIIENVRVDTRKYEMVKV